MNTKSSLRLLLVSALLTVAPALFAQAPAGKLIRVTEKDAAWAAKARQTYPLEVCVTSDEKLGSMGKSPEYIYRVAGQPDRLVLLCCDGCEEDFMKAPAKFTAKLDAAAKAKSAPAKKADAAKPAGEHKHE
jgi:hypothetical protein